MFAALAVARELQAATGVTLKKLVQTLRPLRTVTIDIDGHTITAKPHLTADAQQILAKLPPVAGRLTWHESGLIALLRTHAPDLITEVRRYRGVQAPPA